MSSPSLFILPNGTLDDDERTLVLQPPFASDILNNNPTPPFPIPGGPSLTSRRSGYDRAHTGRLRGIAPLYPSSA